MSEKLAFVFPGQGSQSVGMLADVAEQFETVKKTFDEASEALGQDLWDLSQNGPDTALNSTDITQPALLTAGVALWRVWNEQGGAQPELMSGHSLGEYSALVCAGALGFADAVRLVNKRGLYMQEAVPAGVGAMAAILGLDDEVIAGVCEQAAQSAVVAPVNFNSPGQVVIAGNAEAVERAIALCQEAGAKRAIPLAVSVPSHCSLMEPAAERLQADLAEIDIQLPAIPVVQNVNGKVAASADEIRDNLVKQLYRPVLWTDCVKQLVGQDVGRVLECGPGKVLSGLNKRIERSLKAKSLGSAADLAAALSE